MNIFEHFTSELDYKKKQDVSKCNFHFQMKCKFSKYCTSIIFISPRPTAGVVASTVESKGCPSDHLFQNPNLPQWCQINGRQGHAQQSKLARWRVTDMRTDIQYAFRNQAFQTKNKKHCILGGHHTLQSPPRGRHQAASSANQTFRTTAVGVWNSPIGAIRLIMSSHSKPCAQIHIYFS